MQTPTLFDPRAVGPDTHALTAYLPVAGLGVLPANAYLVRAEQPVLIDAGVMALGDATFDRLASLIDPADLRWIWLTHTDRDHVGCLERLLHAAPRARLVTTFLGLGKLGLAFEVPPERVYLLNPGQTLEVGDRSLLAVRPPSFDAPETTAVFDTTSGHLFSADSFGAVLAEPFESARAIEPGALGRGLAIWAQIDAPWLSWIDDASFRRLLDPIAALAPGCVLSSHLPPAPGMLDPLCRWLDEARRAAAFVGPDQRALVESLTSAAKG